MNSKWRAAPAARVEKAGKVFLLPLVEPLRDAAELAGSSVLIWDEICSSSHGIATSELIEKIAAVYSTDVSEIEESIQGFVLSLRDHGLIVSLGENTDDE